MLQSRRTKRRRFRSRSGRGARSTPPIEHAADPLDQLARGERLCHIFVRAERESFLPLYVAPFGGEHDDAHVPPARIAAYLLANPVATRNHDVEEHQIRRLFRDGSKCRLAIRGRAHAKARLLQQKLERETRAPCAFEIDRAIRGVTPALSTCRRPLHRRLSESEKPTVSPQRSPETRE